MLLALQRFRRPLALAALLCLGGATMAFSPQRRVALDRVLVDVLETRFVRADVTDWDAVKGLVVAGGSSRRVEEALRLARRHVHLKVVLTGAGEDEIAAALQAIDRARVVIEPFAVNTYENAVRSKRLIAPDAGERWLLVTSAYHMPRAIGSFYGAGFFLDPWPVREDISDPASLAHVARHEWLGLVAYWLGGRSAALFPGRETLRETSPGAGAPLEQKRWRCEGNSPWCQPVLM